MLVVNGAGTTSFRDQTRQHSGGRPHTEVHLIARTGRVAMSKAPQVVPQIIGWLSRQFASAQAPPCQRARPDETARTLTFQPRRVRSHHPTEVLTPPHDET
jgi:hypothetical protein